MIIRLKHIFIVLYILQILYENKIVNQSMKYKLQTDPSIAYLSTGDMYTKASVEHRMLNTNVESCVVHNTTAKRIPYLLTFKNNFKI